MEAIKPPIHIPMAMATTVTTTAVMGPLLHPGLVAAALVTSLTAREAMEAAQVLLHGRLAATHLTATATDMTKAVLPELPLLA